MLCGSRRLLLFGAKDAAAFDGFRDTNIVSRWFRSHSSGPKVSQVAVPRTLGGFYEAPESLTGSVLRYYPLRQEITLDHVPVPSVLDVLYTYYFPRELNFEERVKYVSIKTNRTEAEVGDEILEMRRIKGVSAQIIRNGLRGKTLQGALGASGTPLERRYVRSTKDVMTGLFANMYTNNCPDPMLLYNPHYRLAEAVDFGFHRSLRSNREYWFGDLVVNKSIPKARLPTVRGECKFPLEHLEPSHHEAMRLRLAVVALLAKAQQAIVDNFEDTGHQYTGGYIHLREEVIGGEREIEGRVVMEDLDMDLAQRWLDHYYRNHVAPTLGTAAFGVKK